MSDAPNLFALSDNHIREIVRDELTKASPVSEIFDGNSFSDEAAEAIRCIAQEVTKEELRDFDVDDAIHDYFRDNRFDITPR